MADAFLSHASGLDSPASYATDDPAAFEHWSAVMARHYPPAIATWFMAEGRYGEWTMPGATAIAWGARGC